MFRLPHGMKLPIVTRSRRVPSTLPSCWSARYRQAADLDKRPFPSVVECAATMPLNGPLCTPGAALSLYPP